MKTPHLDGVNQCYYVRLYKMERVYDTSEVGLFTLLMIEGLIEIDETNYYSEDIGLEFKNNRAFLKISQN
jgi:hypothetical protein